MAFELILNFISPFSFLKGVKYVEKNLNYNHEIVYEFNDLLLWFMTIRIYLAIKLLLYMTYFMSPRAQRVLAVHGQETSVLFAVKCVLKQRPFVCLGASLVISTVLFGFHLQIFESPMLPITKMNFTTMVNCMWNVVITLATCGYGDLYPVTFFGRVVGVMITFWGVFIASMVVVVV